MAREYVMWHVPPFQPGWKMLDVGPGELPFQPGVGEDYFGEKSARGERLCGDAPDCS